ncbi:MAG TPA: DUF4350 domain-containing protein [Pyrinomonadaceae bacterium]|jgi:hypothetical protein|nr:DUF4350 domain-containing protein [Pyrinomonadaceae bacterium]
MGQRLAIIITITVVLVLLIALNTASYVSEKQAPDTESSPDRSTYNPGATGTLALYNLLAEQGRQVMRWREKPHALLNDDDNNGPATFVVIGKTRIPFERDEAESLLQWVERGGRLVIIDRRPDVRLLPPSDKWSISIEEQELPRPNVHPDNTDEMTAGVARVRASQPSVLTLNVDDVQPSHFAGTINISAPDNTTPVAAQGNAPPPVVEDEEDYENEEPPPPPPMPKNSGAPSQPVYGNQTLRSAAPVSHLEDHRGALLVDYPHGAGRIIILSDPFIVAQDGLPIADNLQLALNVVAGGGGIIAFDEYHQGHAATQNQLVAYFAGTPVLWMFAQGTLIVLVILWTRGRRFARPLPVARVDRRSSLEFVASMAELQQRARAYDLAIENIYTRLRRVLVRYAGVSHNSSRSEIATRVAARSGKLNATRLETLMRECEDAINGASLDERKALELVRQLRMVERVLGLRTRSREARQAAEGLQQHSLL